MKSPHQLATLLPSSAWKTITLIVVGSLLLTASPAYAKKKPAGFIMGPTGILGVFHPNWPKTPTEIRVTGIEKGSPADGTALKAGDKIVGFGNETFTKHPLWEMAPAIDEAEEEGKTLTLRLDTGKRVEIKLTTLGAYSPTAPYDCA